MRKQYLDESALKELVSGITAGIGNQCQDDREALNDILLSFHAYLDTVVRGEAELLMNPHAEGGAYRDLASRYDLERHACHETAIVNVRVLNRLASLYGVSPVFTGDSTQRHQVAEFCLELEQYFFENRRMKLS